LEKKIRKPKLEPFGLRSVDPTNDYIHSVDKVLQEFARDNFETDKDGAVVEFTWDDEWVATKQSFLPCPGTLQYGEHIVTVVNKEDFS